MSGKESRQDREARLAKALRDNLKRRKQQERQKTDGAAEQRRPAVDKTADEEGERA